MTIRRLLQALRRTGSTVEPAAVERLTGALDALREEVERLEAAVQGLDEQAATQRRSIEELAARQQERIDELAGLAALPAARLRTTSVVVEGSAGRRSTIRRLHVGRHVSLPLQPWLGVTTVATETEDVQQLWRRLLTAEAQAVPGELQGLPSSVLDCRAAVVTKGDVLQVRLRADGSDPMPAARLGDVILPRFTHDFLKRKLRNVGHWLLDCLPHMLALEPLAPHAVFLLPPLPSNVHWDSLALVGIRRDRVVIWDGTPIACDRVLVQETEGRIVRGRPLPAMLDLRQRVLSQYPAAARPRRLIYVSRRDATSSRQWVANEMAVEELFERRGFERLVMANYSLEEQVRLFREARVVAGVSGAGLADILFANPGTHVVTLLSDSLIRWYADQAGTRSRWVRARKPPLSALSDSPRFYAHLAAACEQPIHTFLGGEQVPLDRLERFIDEVMLRVERD
ncbi:MAG: DUF563 domain-containing protein [Vicinamibacterales bacterium]